MSTMPRLSVAALAIICLLSQSACDKERAATKADENNRDEPQILKTAPPPIGGPITSTVTILQYQWWADAPDFCRTPKALLDHLDDVLDSDGCMAELIGVNDRAQVSITCLSPVQSNADDGNNCQVEYTGRLWAVRTSNSETDYTLFGQGSLARICTTYDGRERALPALASDTFAQHRASRNLEKHLEPCTN